MPETKITKSKYVFLFLRVLVVVGGVVWAVVWVSREQRWSNLKSIFVQMNWGFFALALVVFALGQVVVGFRWWLLLKTQSVFIDLWMAVKLNFLGLFYNNFMPSSVGGDLLRAWYVTKHTDTRFEAALSVFVDRVIGLFSTVVIACFFYVLFLRGNADGLTFVGPGGFSGFFAKYSGVIVCLSGVFVVLFCGLLSHRRGRALLQKVWLNIKIHSIRLFEKFKKAAYVYCSRPLVLFIVFGLTIFMQIMVITGFWFLGTNLGVTVSIKYYYVFFTLAWVLGALPVSVGGAVVIEGFLVYFFVQFANVGKEAALALALCQRIVWMIASLPGAAIHLMGAHLPRDFFVDYDEPVA